MNTIQRIEQTLQVSREMISNTIDTAPVLTENDLDLLTRALLFHDLVLQAIEGFIKGKVAEQDLTDMIFNLKQRMDAILSGLTEVINNIPVHITKKPLRVGPYQAFYTRKKQKWSICLN